MRTSSRTAPQTITRLAPETAVRWDIPASRNSSSTRRDMAPVSPTTRPGSRPASSGSSTAHAERKLARTDAAAVCHHAAGDTSRGGPRTCSTAAMSSPVRAGASDPVAVSSWPGSNSDHPSAGATSSTRPVLATAVSSTRTVAAWPSTTTAPPRPGWFAYPVVRTGRGRSLRLTRATAAPPRVAASRSGSVLEPCSTRVKGHTTNPPARSSAPAVPTSGSRRTRSSKPATTTATTPTTAAHHQETCKPVSPASHTVAAAGTRRRSCRPVEEVCSPCRRSRPTAGRAIRP